MPSKSLIETSRFEHAERLHSCQANASHKIAKGDVRLKVKNNRSWDHYCEDCGTKILEQDIKKLSLLLESKPAKIR